MTRWLFAVLFLAACTASGLDNGKSSGSPASGSPGDGSSGSADGSSGSHGGSGSPGMVSDGGVLDAAPTPVMGPFPCGSKTCTLNQACYQDCNAAPTCVNASQNDLCNLLGMQCTTGGSCNPNTHMIACACPM